MAEPSTANLSTVYPGSQGMSFHDRSAKTQITFLCLDNRHQMDIGSNYFG
ncbi:hypothetical protein [Epilithonimonas lactis]|nr:hypothetical protein [Epilithonimonas lactis]SEP86801.1 hypothetical protein SAMN04488097_0913 [Epilithonimonas lactis]